MLLEKKVSNWNIKRKEREKSRLYHIGEQTLVSVFVVVVNVVVVVVVIVVVVVVVVVESWFHLADSISKTFVAIKYKENGLTSVSLYTQK